MAVTTKNIGDYGESIACAYLERKGFRLLCRNFRAGKQEIDLVMQHGETTVFVEVKTRANAAYGTPGEFVDAKKRSNLIKAAQNYLIRNECCDTPARFDVVEVYLDNQRIHHIPDAFTL